MTPQSSITCEEFEAEVDELAVGAVAEPRRTALLAHADGCSSCATQLRELADVADQLLLLAPTSPPPPGFESRVVARLGVPGSRQRAQRRAARALAVAAVLLVGAVAGVAFENARHDDGEGRGAAAAVFTRHGTIVAQSGDRVGAVVLMAQPRPHVLVTIDNPRPGPGRRSCELEFADGSRITVGSWNYDEIEGGAWAAGVSRRALGAVRMRVVSEDGRVIATAQLA
jgi:hypothetical protein